MRCSFCDEVRECFLLCVSKSVCLLCVLAWLPCMVIFWFERLEVEDIVVRGDCLDSDWYRSECSQRQRLNNVEQATCLPAKSN